MSVKTGKDWFAAQLKPNSLRIAATNLTRQKIAHFCPHFIETKTRKNNFINKPVPLFPGYIFIQTECIESRWRSINATRGIARLIVDNPRRPRSLPEAFMNALLYRCSEDAVLTEPDELCRGDWIRVLSGPFAETVTRIEKLEPDARLQVLIAIMGQSTRVSLARSVVQAL